MEGGVPIFFFFDRPSMALVLRLNLVVCESSNVGWLTSNQNAFVYVLISNLNSLDLTINSAVLNIFTWWICGAASM